MDIPCDPGRGLEREGLIPVTAPTLLAWTPAPSSSPKVAGRAQESDPRIHSLNERRQEVLGPHCSLENNKLGHKVTLGLGRLRWLGHFLKPLIPEDPQQGLL